MPSRRGMLTLEQLATQVEDGSIDTVLVAFTDMQGRLAGQALRRRLLPRRGGAARRRGVQLPARRRRRDEHGRRLRDVELGARLRRLRAPPRPHDAADGAVARGHRAGAVRRGVGRRRAGRRRRRARSCERQLDRLAARGLVADVGTELEFMLFTDSFDAAWQKDYRDLRPANLYNVDYSMLGTARVEPVLRRIRNGMAGAGMVVESAKGECNLGQHEIAFRYAEALTTCDNHSIYKTGAKEIADQAGMALTFMAKYDEREGNSCHIHISLRGSGDGDGERVPRRRAARLLAALRALPRRSAGVPARADLPVRAERQLLQAVRRGQLRPDGGRLGHGQPHLFAAGRRARRRAAGGEPGAGRRRQPVPRGGRADRGRAARHRAGAAAAAGADRQRLRRRRPARAVDPARRGRRCSPRPRWRPRRSARTSSTTTPTPPASSSRRSTRPSPTGSADAGSSACDAADRDHRVRGGGRLRACGSTRRCCSPAPTPTR